MSFLKYFNYSFSSLEHRFLKQGFTHSIVKIATLLSNFIFLPLIYSNSDLETTSRIFILSTLVVWFLVDTGFTEAVKKLILDRLGEAWPNKSSDIANLFIYFLVLSFVLVSVFFLPTVLIFADAVGLKTVDVIMIALFAMLIIPQKFIRDYLIAEGRGHRFYLIRFYCVVLSFPVGYFILSREDITVFSGVFAFNLFNVVSSILLLKLFFKENGFSFSFSFSFSRSVELVDFYGLKKTGIHFFLIGLTVILIQNSDLLIFAYMYDDETVVDVNVYIRYFQYLVVFGSFFSSLLWPYLSYKNEIEVITNFKIVSLFVFFLCGVLLICFALYILTPLSITYLAGGEVLVNYTLTLYVASYFFCRAIVGFVNAILKYSGKIQILTTFSILETVCHLGVIPLSLMVDLSVENIFLFWSVTALVTRVFIPIFFLVGNE